MKTSNKILLCLLVVVFTIPLMLAFSLKSKMTKGDYIVKYFDNQGSGGMRTGSFSAFKVVKVMAPHPGLLRCRLKLSDKMDYSYYGGSKDSVTVFSSNDTLYIKYIPELKNAEKQQNHDNIEVMVNLPIFNNLVVDGSVVLIDSLPASIGSISLTLLNNGVIEDDSKRKEEESAKASPVDHIEAEKDLQASEITEVETTSSTGIFTKVQEQGWELPDWDIRELLIHSLFYRIK